MQDYNDNNQNRNIRRMPPRGPSGRPGHPPQINSRPPQQGQRPRRPQPGQGMQQGQRPQPSQGIQQGQRPQPGQGIQQGQRTQMSQRPQVITSGERPRIDAQPSRRPAQERPAGRRAQGGKKPRTKAGKNLSPQQAAKKKRRKIVLFVVEILLLLILVGALWVVKKAQNIQIVEIDDTKVKIDKDVQIAIQQEGNSKKGYRNIALFGVDARDRQLDKNTRTDVIMIASINLDTKEVKLVSVYRDTWLNMSTDSYNKANAAYSKGGPEQAISMLNMNLDLDITDFVTIGFDGLIDVIDAVGGVEIDVLEEEISYLNSYQISMVGKVVGKNAAGEDEFDAVPYVEYTPVEHAGTQKLNGLQATAYCRIRYVGDDFQRTLRQRTVLTKVAKKAMTLNPATLDKIANAVLSKVKTSLDTQEILSLLSGIASYKIGEQSGFPFDDSRQTGRVGKASVVIPVDLNYNVKCLHAFLFGNEDYEPSDTVKRCSQKIALDTGVSYKGE